jgi:pyrroloquinoline quinone (PQQ) biosynthesis protein C
MTSAPLTSDILRLLANNPSREELKNVLNGFHRLKRPLSREQVSIVLGQWFHPLHYFPIFLSRMISISPDIQVQAQISRILWQELGEGDSKMSHERIYISTMTAAGYSHSDITGAAPFGDTQDLIEGYRQGSESYFVGLGFMYGTEVADLHMVSTIGKLVRQCSGKKALPWVDVHVKQEPSHVESSSNTLIPRYYEKEQKEIISGAEKMWILWINFFKKIEVAIGQR